MIAFDFLFLCNIQENNEKDQGSKEIKDNTLKNSEKEEKEKSEKKTKVRKKSKKRKRKKKGKKKKKKKASSRRKTKRKRTRKQKRKSKKKKIYWSVIPAAPGVSPQWCARITSNVRYCAPKRK